MRTSTAARRATVAALTLLGLTAMTGCGGGSGTEFGVQERSITVDKGDDFTLEVPANPNLGQNWYLADPRPDSDVLKYDGKREDTEGGDPGVAGSGDGTQYFDFAAVASGRTTVKLLYCPSGLCHSAAQATASPSSSAAPVSGPVPTATGTPDDDVAYFLYEITVR
ncbi:protease inhibitor I42 family protein [Streptomyces sp. NPDC059866]|uniref:protease inhibitor I42 family protein n=1 Tax=Streptomyces sp. NPDC059866 TaxID=3346978 RepID=UPI003655745B